jgi:hypothetical protein
MRALATFDYGSSSVSVTVVRYICVSSFCRRPRQVLSLSSVAFLPVIDVLFVVIVYDGEF